jgi:hypothetical protein
MERLRHWWRSLSPVQSLAMSGAVAALALLLLIGLTRLTPQTKAAIAAVYEGAALVLRDENNSFRTFHDGDTLKVNEGDHIITAQSSVMLMPFTAQQAMLGAGTHVEIVDLEDDAAGNTQIEYLIHRGSLHNIIDEKLDGSDRYVVHSPLLSVSATGTNFTVDARSDAETRVTVLSGTVTVQMGDQVVTVAAGQFLDATAGAPLQVQTSGQAAMGDGDTLVVADLDATPLPVYAAPRTDAATIGTIGADAILRVDARDSSGGWFLVCCVDDRSGWVNIADLGVPYSQVIATPAKSETTPAASAPTP